MFYRVVIKENDKIAYGSQLYFGFNDFNEMIEFVTKIIRISDYNIEIYQLENED